MNAQRMYSLKSEDGTVVRLSALGASIQEVSVMDADGKFANVALPMSTPNDSSYAGATLAPYAGRLSGGKVTIDGRLYTLACNEGVNQLHGGPHNLSHAQWDVARQANGDEWHEICFEAKLLDGVDGYPGNRRFEVTYRLWEGGQLDVLLKAQTDQKTVISLSNHAYWNLSGCFTNTIDAHHLQVEAETVCQNDASHIPTSQMPVAQTSFDFRNPRLISQYNESDAVQLRLANGLNHIFVLEQAAGVRPAAMLCDLQSGRKLCVYTDQPCLLVYTGGYLTPPHCAVALEAVEYPAPPDGSMVRVTTPEKPYQRHISYRFSTIERV